MSAADKVHLGGGWPRRVMPEILDHLPGGDPRAMRSRRDLRVVNRIMGSRSLLLRALDSTVRTAPTRLVDLGSGDGTLTLRLVQSLAQRWPKVRIVLLDKEPTVSAATLAAINDLGWSAETVAADVLDWLEATPREPGSVIFANLFVHHFAGERLNRLLEAVARSSRFFICCEPRRSKLALVAGHLLGLIGCNAVTRHDAVVSVHAGFRDRELSGVWPQDRSAGWQLDEHAAGVFSHLFIAARSR